MAFVDDSVFNPFRDFVNLELPRRPALLTVAITGFDGDPNVSPPVIITNAPVGTWYLRETPDTLYRKRSTGVWIEVGTGAGGGGATRIQPNGYWTLIDVVASLSPTVMASGTSQHFDEYEVLRTGSVVGLQIRFNGNVTAGTATATITVNGTPGTLSVAVGAGQDSAGATQAVGVDSINSGDRVGIELQTDGAFLPSGALDAEAYFEIEN